MLGVIGNGYLRIYASRSREYGNDIACFIDVHNSLLTQINFSSIPQQLIGGTKKFFNSISKIQDNLHYVTASALRFKRPAQ